MKQLDEILHRCNCKETDLAKILGVNRRTIRRYRTGEIRPSQIMLYSIDNLLRNSTTTLRAIRDERLGKPKDGRQFGCR